MNLNKLVLQISCSNFQTLHYSPELSALVGCVKGNNDFFSGECLGRLPLQDFCELLLMLHPKGWNISKERTGDIVILIKS